MTILDNEDILGYSVDNETVCTDCISPTEESELESSDILTEKELEGKTVFCDRCKQKVY